MEQRSSVAPWPRELIQRDLSGDTPYLYLGAWGKETLLGFAVLGPWERGVELANIAVLPEYRRRGIGSQLLTAVCEVALSLGHTKIRLHVRMSHSETSLFYKRLGFRPFSVVRKYYAPLELPSSNAVRRRNPEEGGDALVMEAALPLRLPKESSEKEILS